MSITDESTSDTTVTETDAPRRWPPSLRTVAMGAVAVVVLAALAAVAVLAWQLRADRAVDAAAEQATAAAREFAVVLTSLNPRDVDGKFAAVLDGATGEFKDMYGQSSAQLRSVLIENRAAATGRVVAAGVQSATPDWVEVLLFVDQSVTNADNPRPTLDRSRILMTMEKVDGRWLASSVDIP